MFRETEVRWTTLYPGAITYYDMIHRHYSLTAGNPGDYVAPESVRWLLDAEEKLNGEIAQLTNKL